MGRNILKALMHMWSGEGEGGEIFDQLMNFLLLKKDFLS
jgi:hypothetical protein